MECPDVATSSVFSRDALRLPLRLEPLMMIVEALGRTCDTHGSGTVTPDTIFPGVGDSTTRKCGGCCQLTFSACIELSVSRRCFLTPMRWPGDSTEDHGF